MYHRNNSNAKQNKNSSMVTMQRLTSARGLLTSMSVKLAFLHCLEKAAASSGSSYSLRHDMSTHAADQVLQHPPASNMQNTKVTALTFGISRTACRKAPSTRQRSAAGIS
jgi:hypothetical protein